LFVIAHLVAHTRFVLFNHIHVFQYKGFHSFGVLTIYGEVASQDCVYIDDSNALIKHGHGIEVIHQRLHNLLIN
jgi:hypothetical protein